MKNKYTKHRFKNRTKNKSEITEVTILNYIKSFRIILHDYKMKQLSMKQKDLAAPTHESDIFLPHFHSSVTMGMSFMGIKYYEIKNR